MPLTNPAPATPTQSPEAVSSSLTVHDETDITSGYVDLAEEFGDTVAHDFVELSLKDAEEEVAASVEMGLSF